MLKWVKEVILSTIVLLILDAGFIYLNKDLFQHQIAAVQRVILQFRPEGAMICYFLLAIGINYFIIQKNRSILEAFLLGFIIYGVYESTNYSTLKKWSPYLAIMDTLWGGTLFALTTYVTYALL
jgi:uncharacterized membrane protein